eukprot:gnl/TRDRNA2_/TRDRNA2_178740_c0_seq1.p1 gnl/TRDRNA2_/TRDRNA2_178740_c0~~gnl/TRDRNA2_/TRDRNA2_178740_c0_seq1.p1  ORF type:complete len:352 (-),score=49.45 gnl/TRDRNA2_/TRDRNA2_178740_c0_seq1:75-977(-)
MAWKDDDRNGFGKEYQRYRMNLISMAWCLFLPWFLYCFVYGILSFSLHYKRPWVAYLLVWLSGLLPLVSVGLSMRQALKRRWHPSEDGWRQPTWLVFMAFSLLIAWIVAYILGDLNYFTNMQPYYDLTHLSKHKDIDPSQVRGQQLMDAGPMFFEDGSGLDLKKSMGFKNLDTYCVAPITKDHAQLASYDFWAIGLNCCSGNTADFHCGEYKNPDVSGGVRLMNDEQRPFFRLAVQQAEAAHAIKANHPIFLYWTADPIGEINSYKDEGYKFYFIGMLVHFMFQLLCLALATMSFAKMRG